MSSTTSGVLVIVIENSPGDVTTVPFDLLWLVIVPGGSKLFSTYFFSTVKLYFLANSSTCSTVYVVKSGYNTSLSGINNFSKTNKNEKVPFLGDIPLLGNLFKNDYVNNTFTTTTILIEFIEDTINFELNEKQLIEKYFNDDSWFWAVAATSATRKNSLDYF